MKVKDCLKVCQNSVATLFVLFLECWWMTPLHECPAAFQLHKSGDAEQDLVDLQCHVLRLHNHLRCGIHLMKSTIIFLCFP